jgi:hypothetical protein
MEVEVLELMVQGTLVFEGSPLTVAKFGIGVRRYLEYFDRRSYN